MPSVLVSSPWSIAVAGMVSRIVFGPPLQVKRHPKILSERSAESILRPHPLTWSLYGPKGSQCGQAGSLPHQDAGHPARQDEEPAPTGAHPMSMTITDKYIRSDQTSAGARPGQSSQPYGQWVVSWCPERALTRDQAITAVVLAEEVATWDGERTGTRWLFIEAHADELGLSGDAAVTCLVAYDLRR
jgi:hypothetical protein